MQERPDATSGLMYMLADQVGTFSKIHIISMPLGEIVSIHVNHDNDNPDDGNDNPSDDE